MKKDVASKKRVLVLGINFAPELTGIGKYTGEMVDWLADNGYECNVITAYPYYPNWRILEPYKGRFYKKETAKAGTVKIYRCPLYVPRSPSGMKRILQEITFFISAFFAIVNTLFQRKNDFIFCMAPPFHLGFLALFYRFFKGGKIIYHIQDLQIEASRDLKVIRWDALFGVLFTLEKFITKRVDYISTISIGMMQKINLKTGRNILFFPNWADIDSFYPLTSKKNLKKNWGYEQHHKVVVYSGSIGEKQGLESLIAIAEELETNPSIRFLICGNGPYRDKLINLVKDKGLQNVRFLPLQPLHLFNDFLNMADVHLVLQKKGASDLVMPSKLSTILAAAGLALVTAEKGSSLYKIINENKMGVVIDCEDKALLKQAILDCCEKDNSPLILNARLYAERFLDKRFILTDVMDQLEKEKILPITAIDKLDWEKAL